MARRKTFSSNLKNLRWQHASVIVLFLLVGAFAVGFLVNDATNFLAQVTKGGTNFTVLKGSHQNSFVWPGQAFVNLGSFSVSTTKKNLTLTSVQISLSAEEAQLVKSLVLYELNPSGVPISSYIVPMAGANRFNITAPVVWGNSASTSKTFMIAGNIRSAADYGKEFTATVTGVTARDLSGGTVGQSTNINLQTITVQREELYVSLGAGNPVSSTIIAGTSNAKIAEFRFSAINNSIIQSMLILIPNGAATSTSSIKLRVGGTIVGTQTASSSASLTNSSAQFEGLMINIPANDDTIVEVLADISRIDQGATPGAGISATLDYNDGFRAVAGSGSVITSFGSANISGNTHYIR
jgi:hypothetical protein